MAGKKKKEKVIFTKAKKKSAVARVTLHYPGTGQIRINGYAVSVYAPNSYVGQIILEPFALAPQYRDQVDVSVNVHGGGFMAQAVAIRGAIAKALVELDSDLRDVFLAYDRTLLVDDVRRVEPKKPLGRKARAKKQTSYR